MNLQDSHMTLGAMLEEVAAQYPGRKCLIFERSKYTYRVMNQRVNQIVNGLSKLGVRSGNTVAIFLPNCPEFIFSYFAISKLGGTNVPINTFLSSEEVKFILNDCEVSTIITSPEFFEIVKPIRSSLEKLKNIIIVGGKDPIEGTIPFEQFNKESLELEEKYVVKREDIAVIHYTSGTTGKPKGAMLSHKNLMAAIDANTDAIRINHKDRILVFLPLFHAYTFINCTLATFSQGARVYLLNSVKPFKRVTDTILFSRITVLVGIPPVYSALVNAKIPKFFNWINPIRVCISGAAALPAEVLRKFEKKFKIPLLEGYGLSEASAGVSVNPIHGKRKPFSVGIPIKGVQVKVLDEDGNVLEAPNKVGELIVKGDTVMVGYYNQPEETAKVLKDEWLHTGDMVKIDEEGYIYIVDRKKDMLIVRGMNVYPREVEEILYTHPKVAECAVIGVPDKQRGEVPKAFIILKEGMAATEKEFKRFCHEKIAMYKNPKYFEIRDSLPKTPTGKVLKKVLREEELSKAQDALADDDVGEEEF
jgi:long-chain acyl-CoA synthetase